MRIPFHGERDRRMPDQHLSHLGRHIGRGESRSSLPCRAACPVRDVNTGPKGAELGPYGAMIRDFQGRLLCQAELALKIQHSGSPRVLAARLPVEDDVVIHLVPAGVRGRSRDGVGNPGELTRGSSRMRGVDVVFTAWDIATLGGGKAVSAVAKSGLKTGTREAFRKGIREIAETAAKSEIKAAERLSTSLLARLAQSPKVMMDAAAKKAFTRLPATLALASRSALRKGIPLTAIKYGTREYVINLTVKGTFQEVIRQAATADNSFWASKTMEALSHLNEFLERPAR